MYVSVLKSCVCLVLFAENPPWFYFQFFVDLSRIKKCYTQKGAVFVLEEFGKDALRN
jgi:hypothetical protein